MADSAIQITRATLGEGYSRNQLRHAMKAYARVHFKNMAPVLIESSGQKVKITMSGIDHSMTHFHDENIIHALTELPEIIRRGKKRAVDSKEPYEGHRQDVDFVERYYTPVEICGSKYEAEVVIFVLKDGEGRLESSIFYHQSLRADL